MNSTASEQSFYTQARERLLRRREELAEREQRVRRDLQRANEPLAADFADQAIQRQNDEPLERIGDSAREELLRIQTALDRLNAGTYGSCTHCGQHIEEARLTAVPYAVECARCAQARS